MSSLLRFLPFLFLVFLFISSAALASASDAPLSNNKAKLLHMVKGSVMKASSNEDPTIAPEPLTTALPSEVATTSTGPTTTAYVRLVLTVNKRKAERLSSPNAQGNLRKKIRVIVAAALARPAEGLNITMSIEEFEGTDSSKLNPKVLLIILVGVPSVSLTDSSIGTRAATATDSKSEFYSQLMDETGAESIQVQTSYGFPPSSSDGLPFTSSDDSLFEAYKTLILAVSISIIGVVFLGAIILFLTKTKERRERLLELFRIGGRARREANQSISTFDNRRMNGSRTGPKRTSSRYSGRANSGRKNNSGRAGTASTITAPPQGSVSVPTAPVPAATNQV